MSSSTVINIPTDDKVFERNCVVLFSGILNDPNVKLYGTRGKKQSGLDLIGRRDRDPNQPVGIQCKLITRGAKLAEKTVRQEVAQALTIEPRLTEFYILTTATDEPALDLLAINLSREQADFGRRIDIQVWGWDTLQDRIREDAKALAAFDPNYSASTDKLIALGTETLEGQSRLGTQNEQILQQLQVISTKITLTPVDTERSALEVHLDLQVDRYRDLMNAGKPRTALAMLETLEATLGETSSPAIRARTKANIAFARLRLGDEADGADLLSEAYSLNPSDPKVRANNILALLLKDQFSEAWKFASAILGDDPSNVGAAGFAFQTAAMSPDSLDPLAIIPPQLLEDLAVRVHWINFLRAKSAPDSWWTIAAETLERFPEDGNARRMAGDALVDEALSGDALERGGTLSQARRDKLQRGAMLLHSHWDEIRHYENAAEPNWIMVAYNLITAYRALDDLETAQTISRQMLMLGSNAVDTYLSAAWVAIDRNDLDEAIRLLRLAPEDPKVTLSRMVALSNAHDWKGVLDDSRSEMRDMLPLIERQLFDVLVFRAWHAASPDFDLNREVEALLETWPLGVSAHIAVADIYRKDRPNEAAALAGKAKILIKANGHYSDRVMFAQLSVLREAWDDVIEVLDGYVATTHPSAHLSWLALAFANASITSRTSPFFRSLAPEVMAMPRFSRLAGAAEYNRGDLRAAEQYLNAAIGADPTDLRATLLLVSTLRRDNREEFSKRVLSDVNDEKMFGTAEDLMHLAHLHRRAGETERALKLGYRVAAVNRQTEAVVASYPGLIFLDEKLPSPIGDSGPAQENFWFDLEGLDGTRDVAGVIDTIAREGVDSYAPGHPLVDELLGKHVDDELVLQAAHGVERRYRVRELKHKYIWLLHDIMATHAARFPDATSMFEMSMRDNDVQPVLDVMRRIQSKDDILVSLYANNVVPLAAVAAMAHKPVLAVAHSLTSSGTNLRTCVGADDERNEAVQFVRNARGKGVVLDTLTVWQLSELGHLAAAKAYFGNLCIPRSAFDEVIELRAQIDSNRGREYMTMSFEGDQTWRAVHTPEETEAQFAKVDAVIADLEANCEIFPVDSSSAPRLEKMMGAEAARKLFDPIHLAGDQGLIILSEDLILRQFAAQSNVVGGAWLQVVFSVLCTDGFIAQRDYLIAVGMLGALRHDHLCLDGGVLLGILTLDDHRALALYDAAIQFIGGAKAEMRSHIGVAIDVMRGIWRTDLAPWQKGRAIGRLLAQLTRSRPSDWTAVLHVIDAELGIRASRGDMFAYIARDYMASWIKGHFLDLEGIRSAERVRRELRQKPPIIAA